ncbi:RNA dependent RNA polymerase-domain-containing protein [Phakopsora pachyrhizi]|uniref:RNA-dependent RNA polymerase n=1 Tax=Phakopsora pachyrhizi TaxID=170000 RepID=A0AAV0BT70_PHAPC|nr:RNA dependent RNA polymerase-domain-containing protein [Phakopsora pachyrhizi]
MGMKFQIKRAFNDAVESKESLNNLQQKLGYGLLLDTPNCDSEEPRIKFEPPVWCKSNALNRTYGSDNFLLVKLTDPFEKRVRQESKVGAKAQSTIIKFFNQSIRIGNRVFHTFLRKEEFVNELMDLEMNKNLTVAKWTQTARMSLWISATCATIDFDPENIRRVPDIYSDSLIISLMQMNLVAETLGLGYVLVTAIEGKIGVRSIVWRLGELDDGEDEDQRLIQLWSHQLQCKHHLTIKFRAHRFCSFAKGLWYVDHQASPDDMSEWIEVRDSQWKAEPSTGYKYHFNLCRLSRPVESGHVGKQMIPNQKAIADTLHRATHNPTAYRSFGDEKIKSFGQMEDQQNVDQTIDRLDSISLMPKYSDELKFRIPILEATYVYAMPDPTGTLKENEAFIQFSEFWGPGRRDLEQLVDSFKNADVEEHEKFDVMEYFEEERGDQGLIQFLSAVQGLSLNAKRVKELDVRIRKEFSKVVLSDGRRLVNLIKGDQLPLPDFLRDEPKILNGSFQGNFFNYANGGKVHIFGKTSPISFFLTQLN